MQNKTLLRLQNNKVSSVNATSKEPRSDSAQYAFQLDPQSSENTCDSKTSQSFLVELPDESLGHIIAYVDTPSSLIVLSQVNRRLRNYITDDSTWYRSFAYRYFGTGSECYPSSWQNIILRRSENSWKKEFIKRYNLILRWEMSRSAIMSYQPHSWNVDNMHLMDNMSLMTTSLQYGVVARSFPSTGKILRGFLDASGTANGLGIGNPNTEFSPHVSCVALSSRGGTAQIAWGFRNGEISLTTAPRAMDSNRPAARYLRCRAQDEHPSQVQSLTFASAGNKEDDGLIFSGCSRGQVKLWDSKRLRCLWSGGINKDDEHRDAPNACTELAFLATKGILVAACENGDFTVWPSFQVHRGDASDYMILVEDSIRIAQPWIEKPKTIASLSIDPKSDSSNVIILVRHTEDSVFYRHDINTLRKAVVCSRFGVDVEASFQITSLKPCFVFNGASSGTTATPPIVSKATSSTLSINLPSRWVSKRSSPFILTGDSLGNVSVWNWDTHSDDTESVFSSGNNNRDYKVIQSDVYAQPFRTWEAYEDGTVCSLEADENLIVTGSSHGVIKVWDILTLDLLRTFLPPVTRPSCNGPVGQIFIRGDLLVANIGSRVLVWQPKPGLADKKIKVKRPGKPNKGRGISTSMHRWQQQMELLSDIKETKQDIEMERTRVNRANGRIRAEQTSLDDLGLTEAEAIDYLLMLSREEDEERRRFDLDASDSLSFRSSASLPSASIPALNRSENLDTLFVLDGEDINGGRLTIPTTVVDVDRRVSNAVWSTSSDHTSSDYGSPASSLDESSGFPSIESTSSSHVSARRQRELLRPWSQGSPVGSWQCQSSNSNTFTPSLERSSIQQTRDDEDEELKFILELSLAEARSRGEI